MPGLLPSVLDAAPYREQLLDLIAGGPPADAMETDRGISRLANLAQRLPEALRDRLLEFKAHSNDAGALLIRGLPIGANLPPTPIDKRANRHVDTTAASGLGMVASLLGEMFSYAQLDGGALFRSVFPVPSEQWEQSSKGSRTALLLHTEQTFHRYRPRYLMLLCLRGDPAAQTTLAPVSAILSQLSALEREALARREYVTGIDYAFGNTHTTKGNGAVLPILGGNEENPVLSFDEDLMVGANREASRMLERFAAVARASTIDVCLESGELLIVDNNRVAHGRTPFVPRFDGADRWLMQMKTLDALPPIGPHRKAGTRLVCTQFEASRG